MYSNQHEGSYHPFQSSKDKSDKLICIGVRVEVNKCFLGLSMASCTATTICSDNLSYFGGVWGTFEGMTPKSAKLILRARPKRCRWAAPFTTSIFFPLLFLPWDNDTMDFQGKAKKLSVCVMYERVLLLHRMNTEEYRDS